MDQNISYKLEATVNPLMYKLKLAWQTPVGGEIINGVWNLLQAWIAKNEALSVGHLETTPTSISLTVGVQRRLGPPKRAVPWE